MLTKDRKRILIIFLFTTIPFLLMPCVHMTHDGLFHLRRFEDIYLSVKNGYYLSFISEDLLNNLGYPTLGFYPYLLIFPFALLQFLNISSIFCFMLYVFFISVLSVITSYFFIKEITDDKDKQFVFIYSVIINPYKFFVIYIGGSIGTYSVIPFMFLALVGLFRILKRKRYGIYILSFSMTIVAFTHIISILLISILIAIICLFNIKNIIKNIKIIIEIGISAIITIISSSFAIFPILEQLFSVKMLCNTGNTEFNSYLIEFIFNKKERFLIFLIFVIFSIIYFICKKEKNVKYHLMFLWLIISQTNIFLWEEIKILGYIQFTHRILIFTLVIIGLYLINLDIIKVKKNIKYLGIIVCVLCIFQAAMTNYKASKIDEEKLNDYKLLIEQNIGAFDYIPIDFYKKTNMSIDTLDYKYFNLEYMMELNEGLEFEIIDKNTFRVISSGNNSILLPKFYYKGYEVWVGDDLLDIEGGDYGLIKVKLNNLKTDIIRVDYNGTILQHTTKVISFLCMFLYLIYPFYVFRENIEKEKWLM